MAFVMPLRFSLMLTWPAGPELTFTLPVEWTNRSTTWLFAIGKTVTPGAGWVGLRGAAGLVARMNPATASSRAPASISRRGLRNLDGLRHSRAWAAAGA